MLFGHNPGITQLVNRLARVSIGNVPTCGIAVVEFTAPDWQSVNGLEGQLVNFDYPKNAVDT